MVVKKYPQSHLIISKDGHKICIDPGNYTFQAGFKVEDFADIDVFLVTHQHSDHMDPEKVKSLIGDRLSLGNKDVVSKLESLGVKAEEIKDGETRDVAGFNITAYDLPHCLMIDGSEGPPNTGFLIDGVLFHPGDGNDLPAGRQGLEGLSAEKVALPIAGPSISFKTAVDFAKQLAAKTLIPIHYDAFSIDPEFFKARVESLGFEIIVLKDGQETEI